MSTAIQNYLPIRRIVTENDAQGRSRIVEDGASPHGMQIGDVVGHVVTDLWKTSTVPAQPAIGDNCSVPVQLAPPAGGGTVFRVVQFPPDADWIDGDASHDAFSSMGDPVRMPSSAKAHRIPSCT